MDAQFLSLSMFIVILLFSVVLHEVMHGWVALKFGDRTAENAGRLTLNPLPHIDPIGTILVPILLLLPCFVGVCTGFVFGWAKPVPVNPLNFSNLRRGELMVSAAGILANLSLAILAAVIFHILSALPQTFNPLIARFLQIVITVNLGLAVLNIIPIPPLDGSKVLLSQLPYHLAKQYEKFEPYGFIVLMILLASGFLQIILGFFMNILTSLLGF